MLKVENTETSGWEPAVRGMRNPKNSWEKSDSSFKDYVELPNCPYKVVAFDDMEHYENPTTCVEYVISVINHYRRKYLETKDKRYWWQLIQLLPSSYNQRRTVMLNYEVLSNIYRARRSHKLDEWHSLCAWIESLPYATSLICNINS